MYLSDVYTISTDNELSIQNLNDIYNEITSDFDNLINNEKYGVYLNESKNRYCYKNNDSDNILKHEWKEGYEYDIIITVSSPLEVASTAYLTPWEKGEITLR